MLTLIFFLILIPTLTAVITLGFWYWFNKKSEKAVQIKTVLIEIKNDTSKLFQDIQGLSELISEVAQPLLSPAAIDVESEDVKEEITTEGREEEDLKVEMIKKNENADASEESSKELEVTNKKIGEELTPDPNVLEVVEEEIQDDIDELRNEVKDDAMDELEIFTELIQKEDNISRLEAAMEEWKAKGNDRLALACAVAIEELKVKQNGKQELINLWSDKELQMEEDIAS